MNRIAIVWLVLSLGMLGGCAFVPRVVDVDNMEGRITYPRVDYKGRHQIEFGTFTDERSSKTDFGVGRNKLMMVTTTITMKGDLLPIIEKMVRANFLSSGIEEGPSPLIVNAKLLESYSDLPGPDHIFVRIRMSLDIVEKDSNIPLFHQVFTGYAVVGVVQLGNVAHENAFVEAMNQINEEIHAVANMTGKYFSGQGTLFAGKKGSIRKSLSGSGTGFFISRSGHLITNYHVIDGCKRIELLRDGFQASAKVITKDSINDLALLKSSKESSKVAYFRSGKGIRVGEEIVTIGFPLGEVLGSGVKATTGNVSALTGLSNDITTMQITAPIQPGSSGGPLIDKSGNVVGMISSKLNEIMVAKAIGSISQNVNFAIKSSTLQVFLDTNEFDYQTRQSTKQLNTADIVDESRRYTVRVRCLN